MKTNIVERVVICKIGREGGHLQKYGREGSHLKKYGREGGHFKKRVVI